MDLDLEISQVKEDHLQLLCEYAPGLEVANEEELIKSRTVCMRNLSEFTTSWNVIDFFKGVGRVVNYHFYDKYKGSLKRRRCAVLFDSEESAEKALERNRHLLLGSHVGVKKSKFSIDSIKKRPDDPRIITTEAFCGYNKAQVEKEVRYKLGRYGQIEDVSVLPVKDKARKRVLYLYAVVAFASSSSVERVRKEEGW